MSTIEVMPAVEMGAQQVCTSCGTITMAGASFCSACGGALKEYTTTTKACPGQKDPRCSKVEYDSSVKYCGFCGTKL